MKAVPTMFAKLLLFHSLFCFVIGANVEKEAYLYFSCKNDRHCTKTGSLSLELDDFAVVEYSVKDRNISQTLNVRLITTLPSNSKGNPKEAYMLRIVPDFVMLMENATSGKINVTAINASKTAYLEFGECNTENGSDCPLNQTKSYLKLTIMKSEVWEWVIVVVGWIYFAAWSISFYPQLWLNWKRKSVYGLNFDFLALNFTGFLCYSIYNCAFFWNPTVISQFKAGNLRSAIPVEPNDVAFALHALFITVVTIIQCLIYDRGSQRVSYTCWAILAGLWVYFFVILILGGAGKVSWYEYVSLVTYIKLIVTVIKYIPQAYYNYRRKSTVGWSIGNILLDFTGGSMSLLQLFLQCYNYNDWTQPFTDPTKFGLGMFSILFDILFMVQHYVLYRIPPEEYKKMDNETDAEEGEANPIYGSTAEPSA